jgi:Flp pilus assembly protein CpaB
LSTRPSVIVAKNELPVGTYLDDVDLENSLTRMMRPKSILPPEFITNIDDLKGKRLNRTVRPGDFFAIADVGSHTRVRLPDGMRVHIIRIDRVVHTGPTYEPGKYMDVFWTESLSGGEGTPKMILQKILVIDEEIGKRWEVSLAVTPKQELVLVDAERCGDVRLLLHDENSQD